MITCKSRVNNFFNEFSRSSNAHEQHSIELVDETSERPRWKGENIREKAMGLRYTNGIDLNSFAGTRPAINPEGANRLSSLDNYMSRFFKYHKCSTISR